jgi:hypothetical protein
MKHVRVIYNTPNGTMYETDFGYLKFVRTLSQMEYEISPSLLAQRALQYQWLANEILEAGGFLTTLYGGQTNDFFGDPL